MNIEFYRAYDVLSLTGFDEHKRKDLLLPEKMAEYTGLKWVWELERVLRRIGVSHQIEALIDLDDAPINARNFEGKRQSVLADPNIRAYLVNAPFPLAIGLGVIYRNGRTGEELRLIDLKVKEDARPELLMIEAKNQDGKIKDIALGRLFQSFEQIEQLDFTNPKSPMLPEKVRMFYDLETHQDLDAHLQEKGADLFLQKLMQEHHIV